MINFVNYIEFIFKNSEKSEKKSENYIMITTDTDIRYSCRKNPNFRYIKTLNNIYVFYIFKCIQFFSKLVLYKYLLYFKKFSESNNLTLKKLKTFIHVNS
jgi:hypothetical protein